jgi:hypothetical protein
MSLYKNEEAFIPLYGVRTDINELNDECKYFLFNSATIERVIINTLTQIDEEQQIMISIAICEQNEINIIGDYSAYLFPGNILDFPLDQWIPENKSFIVKIKNLGNKNIKINGSLILINDI